MKKNKFTFLVATSFLAVSALVGCNKSEEPSGGNSAAISSDALVSSDIINTSSNNLGSSVIPDSSSSNPSSASSDPISGSSDGGASSSSSSSSSSSGGGEQEVKTDWTDDEKGVMRSHLYGLVLPFVASDVTASYSADSNTVLLEGRNSMSDTFLAGYAANFTTANGWEGGDISEQMNYYAGTAYAYQKAVTQNGVKRYVVIYFTGLIEHEDGPQTYGKTGKFYLEAVDPYLYEYPAAMIEQWLDMVYDTSIVPPSFEADYYNADTAGLLLGRSDNNIEDAYKAKLDADANFTVDANKNENGFYVAHPSDASYVLLFKYDATNKMMMLKVEAPRGWNSDIINAFLTKYNCQGLVIPSISDPNIGFRFRTSEETAGREGGIVTVTDISLQAAQAYVDSMKTAGYLLDDDQVVYDGTIWSSVGYLVTDYGTYSVMVTYDEVDNSGRLMIIFGASRDTTRVKSWPAAAIAALLSATQDSVPAFTGDNLGFTHLTSNDANTVMIYLTEGTVDAAKTAYIGKLIENNYVAHATTGSIQQFRSQNNEILVSVMPVTSGGRSILVINAENFPRTEWPAQAIAAAIVSNVSGGQSMTDTIPALNVDLAELCTVNTNYSDEFEICIDGLGSSLADFKKVFTQNGWIDAAYYEYDGPSQKGVLVSPNRQLMAYFSTYGEGKNISILVSKYYARDLKVVGTFSNVDKWDFNYSEISFVDSTDPKEVADGMYQTQLLAQFDVVAGDKFKVSNGVEWYGYEDIPQADRPNQSDFDTDDDKNIIAVKDGTVKLFLKELADGSRKIYVCYKPELVPWPSAQVTAALEGWNVEDAIPVLQDEAITAINFTEINSEKFSLTLVGGASLDNRYEGYLDDDYDEDSGWWISSSGKIAIQVHADGQDLVITVKLQSEPQPDGYPTDDISSWLEGFHATDELPDIHLENVEYSTDVDSEGCNVLVYTPTGSNTVSNIYTALLALFDDVDNHFTEEGTGFYTSLHGDFSIVIANETDFVTLTFYSGGYTSIYPSAKISQLLDGLTVCDTLSNEVLADASYEWFWPEDGDEFAYLNVYKNGEDYSSLVDSICGQLYSEGFEQRYIDLGFYDGTVLVSPDRDYCVFVEDKLTNVTIAICNLSTLAEPVPMFASYALVPQDGDSWIFNDQAHFYAYIWGGSYDEPFWMEVEYDNIDGCFYLDGIDDAASIIVVRAAADFDNDWNHVWNQTSDIHLSSQGETIVFHINP